MNTSISDKIKSEIIALWCSGLQRDRIAKGLGISGGTVSNVVSKWKNEIGVPHTEAVRNFGVLAKGQNVTAVSRRNSLQSSSSNFMICVNLSRRSIKGSFLSVVRY